MSNFFTDEERTTMRIAYHTELCQKYGSIKAYYDQRDPDHEEKKDIWRHKANNFIEEILVEDIRINLLTKSSSWADLIELAVESLTRSQNSPKLILGSTRAI